MSARSAISTFADRVNSKFLHVLRHEDQEARAQVLLQLSQWVASTVKRSKDAGGVGAALKSLSSSVVRLRELSAEELSVDIGLMTILRYYGSELMSDQLTGVVQYKPSYCMQLYFACLSETDVTGIDNAECLKTCKLMCKLILSLNNSWARFSETMSTGAASRHGIDAFITHVAKNPTGKRNYKAFYQPIGDMITHSKKCSFGGAASDVVLSTLTATVELIKKCVANKNGGWLMKDGRNSLDNKNIRDLYATIKSEYTRQSEKHKQLRWPKFSEKIQERLTCVMHFINLIRAGGRAAK